MFHHFPPPRFHKVERKGLMEQKLKILVVDDNEELCMNVTDILEMNGHEVTIALDGFKALELVEQDKFDVVLMDIKMPVMDGVETYKRMRKISPETPVIMMTAFAVEDLIREALRTGAYGMMNKPLDFNRLLQTIAQATGTGAMIMVADDDENLCSNLEDILASSNYRVIVAHDGSSAVETAEKNNFDIIIIDLKLPALNGLEAYLAIRDFRPDVVAIIITGHITEMNDLAQQAIAENAYTCLEKPLNMNELMEMIEKINESRER